MRLFVAVTLDDQARATMARSIGELRANLRGATPVGARVVSWVEPSHLHLTLHFLGDVDGLHVPGLASALAEPLPMAPFDLGFGEWGLFPSKGPVRVIWIGVTYGAPLLAKLHQLVGERLTREGVALESRPLSPHLTVGRVKQPTSVAWHAAMRTAAPPAGTACRIDHCTLYQSRLSPAGPTYLVQACARLHP